MMWRKFIAGYLTFSKKERIAVVFFCSSILLLALWPTLSPKRAAIPLQKDSVLSKLLDTATRLAQLRPETAAEDETPVYQYEASKKAGYTEGALFYFDPNTLDASGWKGLGLQDRTVKTILNYRSKGGHFYKDEDLKKIWGLPEGFYEHVKDYIQIAVPKKEDAPDSNFFKTPYKKIERKIDVVDVNQSDTSALIALPGIGSKLAQRIVNFRDKLGGFYSVEQISETYGLPDSTFQKLKPYLQVHGVLKKFNINSATKEELKTHPYIKWNLANAIVEYRNQHGPFKNVDELKNVMLIDNVTFHKIVPYFIL